MVERWNIFVEAHEWQCEAVNDAAQKAAEDGRYPYGEVVPADAFDATHQQLDRLLEAVERSHRAENHQGGRTLWAKEIATEKAETRQALYNLAAAIEAERKGEGQ